jgi:hypothetical protein
MTPPWPPPQAPAVQVTFSDLSSEGRCKILTLCRVSQGAPASALQVRRCGEPRCVASRSRRCRGLDRAHVRAVVGGRDRYSVTRRPAGSRARGSSSTRPAFPLHRRPFWLRSRRRKPSPRAARPSSGRLASTYVQRASRCAFHASCDMATPAAARAYRGRRGLPTAPSPRPTSSHTQGPAV